MKIAFVKPPFYRLAGSHSNKVSAELSYWRGIAEAAGHETMFYNGEQSGSEKYWPWRTLMQNTDMFKSMVDLGTRNPLLWEIAEAVMGWGPDIVVISSYDAFFPSVSLDAPYVCGMMAEVFQELEVFVVGVGAFFPSDTHIRESTNLSLKGGPSVYGVRLIEEQYKQGKIQPSFGKLLDAGGWDSAIPPCIENPQPYPALADYSYVVTTKGCTFPCKFCYNTLVANKFEERPIGSVLDDLAARILKEPSRTKYYFTDQIFTRNLPRLKELRDGIKERFSSNRLEFTVEARNELMNKGGPEMAEVMYDMGVRVAKMGIENTGDLFNQGMKKRQKEQDLCTATKYMRDAGIKVSAYLFLGGSDDAGYRDTLEFCQDVDFDGYIISMWSHPMSELNQSPPPWRYDAHWSLARKEELGIPDWVLEDFLKLQESKGGNSSLAIL